MKTIMRIILVIIIILAPISICAILNTDNVFLLAPSIAWVIICPILILIFYDNIEVYFNRKQK